MHTSTRTHPFLFWHQMGETPWIQGMPPFPLLLEISAIIPLGLSTMLFVSNYLDSFPLSTDFKEGKSEMTMQEIYPNENKEADLPPRTFNYTVKAGDTIYQIAKKFTTTMQAILKVNHLVNSEEIRPGQVIKIPQSPPGAVIYTVRSGDSLQRIATRYGTNVEDIVMFNYTVNPDLIYPGQQLIIPVGQKD